MRSQRATQPQYEYVAIEVQVGAVNFIYLCRHGKDGELEGSFGFVVGSSLSLYIR